ncbi:hypothetical protein ACFQH7_21040 [Microbulbifer taiwanensis]
MLARNGNFEEYAPETEFRDCLQRLELAVSKQHKRGLLNQLKSSNGQLSAEELAILAHWKPKN